MSTPEYRAANKVKIAAADKKRRALKPAQEAAHKKIWATLNPDKIRAARIKHSQNKPETRKNWVTVNQDKIRAGHLRRAYGLTLEEFDAMRLAQNYSCFLCKRHEDVCPRKKLYVDHSHSTGLLRKLLCLNCNALLGHAKESITILLAAIEYLKL